MHIAEGYLPLAHCVLWSAASLPFVIDSTQQLGETPVRSRRFELAATGGLLLLLTALKIPSVAGSSSHPTGVALAAILFGPRAVPGLAMVVLLLQALLLAHGGITTLGANLFSLGVCGPFAAWLIYRAAIRLGAKPAWACGVAAALSSLAVYSATSLQLAMAYPDPVSGVLGSAGKFGAVFAWTQIPVAITEGFLTSAAFSLMNRGAHSAPSDTRLEAAR